MEEDEVKDRIFEIYKTGVTRLRPNFTGLTPETKFKEELRFRSGDRKAFAKPVNDFLKEHGKKRLGRPTIAGCKNIQEVQKKVWKQYSVQEQKT